jgi:hypothetical protein
LSPHLIQHKPIMDPPYQMDFANHGIGTNLTPSLAGLNADVCW